MPPITDILFGDADMRRNVNAPAQAAANESQPSVAIAPAGVGDRATEISFAAPGFDFTLTITADTQDYDVEAEFVAAFGAPPADVSLQVVVNSGVVVSASATGTPALTWGNSWTGTPTFQLENNGYIIGKGGAGAQDANHDGGNALELSGQIVSIINAAGNIWGGGGGGGSGDSYQNVDIGACDAGGGGGGGGAGDGAGGTPASNGGVGVFWTQLAAPTNGTAPAGALISQTGGAGGTGGDLVSTTNGFTATGGLGGAGGNYGMNGEDGLPGSGTGGGSSFVTVLGGNAGLAVSLSGGTANFTSGGTSPNVEGAIA